MLFFSTFLYTFARTHGKRWHEEAKREMELGTQSRIQAFRTLASLSAIREPIVTALHAPMRLAAGRSDMAGRFLDTSADVWVSCDDDAEADRFTCARLVDAARDTRGIVSAPCLQRGDPEKPPTKEGPGLLNVRFGLVTPKVGDGFALVPIHSTGFGLVAVHREVIETLCERFPELDTEDEDSGRRIPALFFERITGQAPHRRWQGEDMAFCARARECALPMHALLGADVIHAGRRVRLEPDADGFVSMRVYDV
jgi:hypothetical protein